MEEKLTKTEIKRRVNKEFYEFVEANYPDYFLDQHGDSGYYTFLASGTNNWRDCIDYHIGRHEICTANDCGTQTEKIAKEWEAKLKEIQAKYNT